MNRNGFAYGALGFLLLFLLVPYLSVLIYGLGEGGESLREVFANPVNRKILGFTFKQALVSTVFSIAAGLPGAFILGRYRFSGDGIVKAVATIPFVLPSILVVLGFVMFFGNNGVLNRVLMGLFGLEKPPLPILYSFRGIILAHVFYNFPICLRIVSSAWEQEPRALIHAARTLGSGKLRTFFTVTVPRLLPSIGASAILIFLFCFNSFAVILVLGGGPRFTTMEVEIYRLARMSLDFRAASALSIVSSAVSMTAVFCFFLLSRAGSTERWPEERSGRIKPPLSSMPIAGKLLSAVYLLLAVCAVLGPMLSIAWYSFVKPATRAGAFRFSLEGYRAILSASPAGAPVIRSVLLSVLIAAAAALLSVLFASLAVSAPERGKIGRALPVLSLLPMAVSPIVLGLGYIRFAGLSDSILGVLLLITIHTVISFPFSYQSVSAAARQISPEIIAAGRSLGSGQSGVFRKILVPLLLPGILTGGSFSFAISLGEMQAAMMLLGGRSTIPIALYRLIGSYNFHGACALGTILIVLCACMFYFVLGFENSREGYPWVSR